MSRAVFWQNCPSMHQAALIRAVGNAIGEPSVVVVEAPLDERRTGSGWRFPDYGDSEVIVAPSDPDRRRLERLHAGAAIHIFTGLGVYPATARSMAELGALGSRAGSVRLVFTEPWWARSWHRILRPVKYGLARARYRGCVDAVLACGTTGVRQYRRIGFHRSRVFEFGYFLDAGDAPPGEHGDGGPFRILFIGSLDTRKRPDWVLRALSGIHDRDWTLDIVGSGPLNAELKRLAARLCPGDRVRWRGVLRNEDVATLLAASDVLVLPSRHDGWGAVVNEALRVGTPAIVSDAAGASALVAGSARGSVFPSGSLDGLREALVRHMHQGRVGTERREQIRSWTAQCASAPAAAAYLLDVVTSMREHVPAPVPPWREAQQVNVP